MTTGHSSPFARWNVTRSTASVSAAMSSVRIVAASQSEKPVVVPAGSRARYSWPSRTTASRLRRRSSVRPVPSSPSPSTSSASLTIASRSASRGARGLVPRWRGSRNHARTSGCSRSLPPPRTRHGTFAARSASSSSASCALVRASTARWRHPIVGPRRSRTRRAAAAASTTSVGYDEIDGTGPSACVVRRPRTSRTLDATRTICGLDR